MMRTLPSCSGVSYIPLKDTGFFSALVNDYVQQKDTLSGLYNFAPNDAGLAEAIAQRAAAAKYPNSVFPFRRSSKLVVSKHFSIA